MHSARRFASTLFILLKGKEKPKAAEQAPLYKARLEATAR